MTVLVTSLWLCVALLLLFFARFVATRVLRRIKGEAGNRHRRAAAFDSAEAWERFFEEMSHGAYHEEEEKKNEQSIFQFKFGLQNPDSSLYKSIAEESDEPFFTQATQAEEERKPQPTVSVSNYRFVSEKGLSGFVQQPEVMTCRILESFVSENLGKGHNDRSHDSEKLDTELRGRLSSVKNLLHQCNSDDPNGDFANKSEEKLLDAELRERLISAKDLLHQQRSSDDSTRGYSVNKSDKLDSELRGRFSSVKNSLHQRNSVEEKHGGKLHNYERSPCSYQEVVEISEELEKSDCLGSCHGEEETCKELTNESAVVDTKLLGDGDMIPDETGIGFLKEREFNCLDLDCESLSGSDGYSVKDLVLDYSSDGFLSERDFDEPEPGDGSNEEDSQLLDTSNRTGEHDPRNSLGSEKHTGEPEFETKHLEGEQQVEFLGLKQVQFPSSSVSGEEFIDLRSERVSLLMNQDSYLSCSNQALTDKSIHQLPNSDEDSDEEKESDMPSKISSDLCSHQSDDRDTSVKQGGDLCETKGDNAKDCCGKETKTMEGSGNMEEEEDLKISKDFKDEEADDLEFLWEHQELIEQLKKELKKARAIGLPTILEESESPKSIEDLKSWKIDDKFLHEDPLDDLQKFYKSYRERMRKFDILNYQKMYAIGFLQLKDPLQSMSSQKPTITSFFSENFWPCRRKKPKDGPSEKFIKELQGDLEIVYVGQLCLSWEFLWWQYEKSQQLYESHSSSCRQYNQVAVEFQQFQVILQRFLEDEPYQGARVPHYVKNRCILRNLLQVPLIKEDCKKGKMQEIRDGDCAITSEGIIYIMEKSIKIFWQFVKSDKDESLGIVKGLIGAHAELQDPTDIELMTEIQSTLNKKEKKLKEIQKVGSCLVKKFKKPQEQRTSKEIFYSQIDMKLVSRVLEMSRITTDQLVWCHNKLSKITFLDRRLHREPSFLLFPC